MKQNPILILILISLILFSCSREHSNPADPDNPFSDSEIPKAPEITAIKIRVGELTVQWSSVYAAEKYKIYRASEEDPAFSHIATVQDSLDYLDQNLIPETAYSYKVSAMNQYGLEGGQSPQKTAEPLSFGAFCWVADASSDSAKVVKLAGDGSTLIVEVTGMQKPQDVSADLDDGGCWVADKTNVVKLAENGKREASIRGFQNATTISYDRNSKSCWVFDRGTGDIVHIFGTAEELNNYNASSPNGSHHKRIGGFTNIKAIDTDSDNGNCWAIDHKANGVVYQLNKDSEIEREIVGFRYPTGITIDTNNDLCWISDWFADPDTTTGDTLFGGVTKINLEIPDGYDVSISDSDAYWQRYYYAGTHFNQPLDVSADKETGDCWISDHNPQFGSRIVRISIDGNIKVSTSGSEGLRNPTSISADFVEGSCWVADSEENYQVVKFSVEGIEEGRTSSQLLDVPVAVSVYPLLEE